MHAVSDEQCYLLIKSNRENEKNSVYIDKFACDWTCGL
jgi:hypothetical protein